MARRLRVLGSTSGVGDCPTLYEDLDSGEALVQGDEVTDPTDVAQLKFVKEGEAFVVVPRALLANFSPKEVTYVPEFVPQQKISEFINDGFEQTAWRLETRSGYASDQAMPSYQEFLRTGDTAGEVGRPGESAPSPRPAHATYGRPRRTGAPHAPIARPRIAGRCTGARRHWQAADSADHSARRSRDRTFSADRARLDTYFAKVAEAFTPRERPSSLLITHLLPERPAFVGAVSRVSHLRAVLPKPNVRRIVDSGKRFERVRIVDNRLTTGHFAGSGQAKLRTDVSAGG
ncbi:DUF6879 family protein [Streptomyces sp. NPDC091287]|uniref:DUF6879 family protein n=1 Tax=Streptomyces sp. NPDC091287 TaxID=3365988 RepID=UPI00380AB4A0